MTRLFEEGTMTKHYVVATLADVVPGDVRIVGPFENQDAAAAWGEMWQEVNGDNPCWQCVTLPDGFVPEIVAP
jgi:hypothetical protein